MSTTQNSPVVKDKTPSSRSSSLLPPSADSDRSSEKMIKPALSLPMRKHLAFFALSTTLFLAALDTVLIATALPTIAEQFKVTDAGYAWVGSIYLLTASHIQRSHTILFQTANMNLVRSNCTNMGWRFRGLWQEANPSPCKCNLFHRQFDFRTLQGFSYAACWTCCARRWSWRYHDSCLYLRWRYLQ